MNSLVSWIPFLSLCKSFPLSVVLLQTRNLFARLELPGLGEAPYIAKWSPSHSTCLLYQCIFFLYVALLAMELEARACCLCASTLRDVTIPMPILDDTQESLM